MALSLGKPQEFTPLAYHLDRVDARCWPIRLWNERGTLDRYIREFAGRHNMQSRNKLDMMRSVTMGMIGKRLR